MFNCFNQTLKTDGIARGLYAGSVPALVANITENSVLFLCYGFCQKMMQKLTNTERVENLSTLSNATAGCLASFFSSVAICPMELVKCKLQAMHETQKQQLLLGKPFEPVGPLKLTTQIFVQEGATGLFRGLIPLLVREMPGYFFFFGGYEGTRSFLQKDGQGKDDLGLLKTMVAGGIGGLVFWATTYPIDVVKSRIQVNNQKENFAALTLQIFRKEGIGALYNGLTPTLVRTIPATATLFVAYEYSKKFLHSAFKDF